MAAPRDSPALAGRAAVLDLLKREGPISADSLGERLDITAMAVRQHLYSLTEAGAPLPRTRPPPPR